MQSTRGGRPEASQSVCHDHGAAVTVAPAAAAAAVAATAMSEYRSLAAPDRQCIEHDLNTVTVGHGPPDS
jgi:hypothetical protein